MYSPVKTIVSIKVVQKNIASVKKDPILGDNVTRVILVGPYLHRIKS